MLLSPSPPHTHSHTTEIIGRTSIACWWRNLEAPSSEARQPVDPAEICMWSCGQSTSRPMTRKRRQERKSGNDVYPPFQPQLQALVLSFLLLFQSLLEEGGRWHSSWCTDGGKEQRIPKQWEGPEGAICSALLRYALLFLFHPLFSLFNFSASVTIYVVAW